MGEVNREPAPRQRKWPRRALRVLLAASLSLTLLIAGAFVFALDRYAGNVERIPGVFAGLDEEGRPPANAAIKTTTFLLIGVDTRADGPTTGTGATAADPGSQSDAIMLVQIVDGGAHASIISIPRDSWVPIPGHGMDKINAANAIGGPTLLVQTVEELTDVRVDHFAAIDFDGFNAITDALGGVTVNVSTQTESRGHTFHPGPNRLDGDSALIYVRQRYGLPGSDFDRVQRQQNFLRAVLTEVRSHNLLGSPGGSDKIVLAFTDAVSVDDSISNDDLLKMARTVSKLSAADVNYLTAPVAGTGWEGEQSVVYLDDAKLGRMMSELRAGTLPQDAAQYTVLPDSPN